MIGIEIGIVLLLTVLNGVFAMSELAVVSSREIRLQQRLERGQRGAQAALDLAADPNRFLSTVQIGITLIGIGTGAFGGATLSGRFGSMMAGLPLIGEYSTQIAGVVVVVSITYLSLIIGELVPKRLALQNPEGMACLVAPTMRGLSRVTSPVVSFLAISSDAVFRLLGLKPSEDAVVSDEEIEQLLRQGTEAGVFHETERAMVSSVLDIADRNAGEMMTPRHRMVVLNLDDPAEVAMERMATTPHNFYPVCDGETDNMVGVVATRELWRRQLVNEPIDIQAAMEAPLFVPEGASMLTVMEQLRPLLSPMAIVVDEYGGVSGLITLNDVVADLVGDDIIEDTSDNRKATRRTDGSFLIDGDYAAHEVIELLELRELPGEPEGRFETLAGFIVDQLGEIPAAAAHVNHGGYRFEVVDMDGNRIDKVLVQAIAPAMVDRDDRKST